MPATREWQRGDLALVAAFLLLIASPAHAGPILTATTPDGWAKEIITSSSLNTYPREVRATVLDGKPSVFFNHYDGATSSNGVKLAQRQPDGSWSVSTVLPSGSSGVWMDYASIGGTPWLAVGRFGQVELYSRGPSGTWTSQHLRTGGQQYGDRVALADNGGEPMAVYQGTDGSFYSRTVHFLERAAGGGGWTESQIPLPLYSIIHLDVQRFGTKPVVLTSYENQGVFYSERAGGVWNSHESSGEHLGEAVLDDDGNGNPTYFAAYKRSYSPILPSRVYTRSGGGWSSTVVNPLSYPVGADYKVLDGVPTVAYFERGNGTQSQLLLHLAQYRNGAWDDIVLDSGHTSYPREVSLVSVDGLPAVAVYNQMLGEIAYYHAIPEPAGVTILVAAAAGCALARRRPR